MAVRGREQEGGAEIEDEDPSSWVPLEPNGGESLISNCEREDCNEVESNSCSINLSSSTDSANIYAGSSLSAPPDGSRQVGYPTGRRSEKESLRSIRRTLEDRHLLRRTIIHPMSNFPGKFSRHLLIELFRFEPHVRVGLTLITIGALLQVVAILHLLSSYRRSIMLVLLFLVPFLFVDKKAQQLLQLFSSLDDPVHLMDTAFAGLENIDSLQLRRVFFAFSIFPAMLEMWSIVFLAETVLESSWTIISAASLSMLTISVCSVVSGVPARDSSLRAMVCLYTFALFVASTQMRLGLMNVLAAPFLLAAGSLVLYHPCGEFDCLSRSVRQSLRSTLGEILTEFRGNAAEDEMLQLAALRWIVDYWESASTCSNVGTSYDGTRNGHKSSSGGTVSLSDFSDTRTEPPSCDDPTQSEVMTTWLQITTNQMRGEVNMPDQRQETEYHEKEKKNPEANRSFENLYSMLGSMDIDSRAKPAVQAYRSAIERIPPSRNAAIFLALFRRSLSLCSLIFLFTKRHMLQSLVTLLPLLMLELVRVKEWANSCATFSTEEEVSPTSNHWLPPARVSDTIFIMLCPDRYDKNQPSQLLQVWNNIISSVIALERSLLAARCAQTGAAVTELSLSLVSLSRLGAEVYNRGWAHGLGVLANDCFLFFPLWFIRSNWLCCCCRECIQK